MSAFPVEWVRTKECREKTLHIRGMGAGGPHVFCYVGRLSPRAWLIEMLEACAQDIIRVISYPIKCKILASNEPHALQIEVLTGRFLISNLPHMACRGCSVTAGCPVTEVPKLGFIASSATPVTPFPHSHWAAVVVVGMVKSQSRW